MIETSLIEIIPAEILRIIRSQRRRKHRRNGYAMHTGVVEKLDAETKPNILRRAEDLLNMPYNVAYEGAGIWNK